MLCGDGVQGQVNPSVFDAYWFLEKTFSPGDISAVRPILSPFTKLKNNPKRLTIAEALAEKEAKGKQIRCSFCKFYGHNKLRYQTIIKLALTRRS